MRIECLRDSKNEPIAIRACGKINTFGESCFCGLARGLLFTDKRYDCVRFFIGDKDDTDISVDYYTGDPAKTKFVFHELLNYLNDVDGATVNTKIFFDNDENGIPSFFPVIEGISRKRA